MKRRSMNELIVEVFLVEEEEDYFTAPEDITIEYGGAEIIDGSIFFGDDSDGNVVSFATPCGLDHVNEHDVDRNDQVFDVFRKERI